MVDRRPGMEQVTQHVTQIVQTAIASDAERIPYIAQARASADMTDGQKEFIRLYNLMRNTLIKHNLMEDKK